MRSMILLLGWMLVAGQPLWAKNLNQAIFTSVDGDVRVILKAGQKPVSAQEDMAIAEGTRVIARADSSATLLFFDGSELTVSPKTEFQLTKLQKPTATDKMFHFDLFIGKIAAAVKALTTSKSAFEIEAGGVVCAVRGTHYKIEFDPQTRKMLLNVDDGKVLVHQMGKPDDLVKGGEHRLFSDLHVTVPKGSNLKALSTEVGETPSGPATNSSPLNNPALKSMIQNSQAVNQTNKTNLVKTIQQNSSVNLHVGSGETVP